MTNGASAFADGKAMRMKCRLWTITEAKIMTRPAYPARRTFSPEAIHPGEHLREDFMRPLKLSVNALALALRVPATRILAIVKEKRRISPHTALRLARYFGTSPEFWLNLQTHYELALAERESMAAIASEVSPRKRKTA
jgi:antitoxin HigA-1